MVNPKKINEKTTKKEMLEAYHDLLHQIEDKKKQELDPEKVKEEKKNSKLVDEVKAITPDKVVATIAGLKKDISGKLDEISENLEGESEKLIKLQEAIKIKNSELNEIYEIEKNAFTLFALIESQKKKRDEFEELMAEEKEELEAEIIEIKESWKKERELYQSQIKENEAAEKKIREREKEEYLYEFKREKELAKNKFEDEKAQLEKDLTQMKENAENEIIERTSELNQREKTVKEKESYIRDLELRVSALEKEIGLSVEKAVKETTEKITLEYKAKIELMKNQSEGTQNVMAEKITQLESVISDLKKQNDKFSVQLETAYKKVEDVALKALDSSSGSKAFAKIEDLLSEKSRKE